VDLDPKKLLPKVTQSNKRAGWLLSGLTLLTLLFTTLGIQGSELSDLWRNQEILSIVAVTLVLAAITLGALAGWVLNGQARQARALLWGNILLGLGLIVIAWSVVINASSSPSPTVSAAAQRTKRSTYLKAVVEDDKLTSGESVQVKVQPLFEEEDDEQLHYRAGRAIYEAIFGPGSDGSVHRVIRVGIPPGSFPDIGVRASTSNPSSDCFDTEARNGCVIVRVPPHSDPPELSYGWKRNSLRVHVTAFDVPTGEIQFLVVGRKPKRTLLHTEISADLSDDVRRTFSVPVAGVKAVCVIASAHKGKLGCPPRGNQPGWALLRVPG
jgi:hypothetical protein